MNVSLFKAFSQIKDEKEFDNFLRDLCTPGEIQALRERWQIAQALYEGELSYREIEAELGSSLATITRIARFLKDEPYQGYNLILGRLARKPKNKGPSERK